MGIEGDLRLVCESNKWSSSDLSDLSLTGLQPCFEDVILRFLSFLLKRFFDISPL